MDKLKLSKLSKTWILDLDGTIVKHNGYKIDGVDTILPGALNFLNNISKEDIVIFLTSRSEEYKEITENFLVENKIKFNEIIYNIPFGERILINDDKPSGLSMAYAIRKERDSEINIEYEIDEEI